MKITTKELSALFDDLLADRKSREEVSAWACEAMKKEDEGELEYEPASEEEKLWDAVMYLLGVDSKTRPNQYLFSRDDIADYRKEAGI